MNLYAHDCSYLRTEYGRNKDIESYHAEIHRECDEYRIANGQKPILDDGEQDGNEYKSLFPVRPRTPKPDKRVV